MEEIATFDIATAIGQYGFPIIAALGLGYFIFYIWKWVTEEVNPVIEESHLTLIALIDRARMLDNDLIRMKVKLDLILEQQEKTGYEKNRYKNTGSNNATNNKPSKSK